jgi:hypothetical protein
MMFLFSVATTQVQLSEAKDSGKLTYPYGAIAPEADIRLFSKVKGAEFYMRGKMMAQA